MGETPHQKEARVDWDQELPDMRNPKSQNFLLPKATADIVLVVQLIDVKERDHFFAAPVEPQHHVGRSKFDGSSTLCVGRKCLTGHVAKSSHSQFAGWEGKPFIFLCVLHLGERHVNRMSAQRRGTSKSST